MAPESKAKASPTPPPANVRYIQPGSPLPQPLAPFIGRTREIEALRALLTSTDVRLLTLTGPGGVGKTRLAIQAATGMQAVLHSAIHFVALADLATADQVPFAVTAALDASDGGVKPLIDSIRAAVRDLPTLLILDNVEHLLPEVTTFISEILATCPTVRILATSRSPLRIYGEQRFPVQPLPLTNGHTRHQAVTDSEPDAIRLFIQRARTVDPTLTIGPNERQDIAAICARLDGLPLAIELAAARAAELSPKTFLHRLEHQLPVPQGGARDKPRRQQTMTAAVAWSYDLLDPGQQAMFRRLAVCAGEFDLAAAEALGAGIAHNLRDYGGYERSSIDILADLAEASLIQRQPHNDDEQQYRMLQSIRTYALTQLTAAGEESDARQVHAEYFLGQVNVVNQHLLSGRDVNHWLAYVEQRLANVRSAMSWCLLYDPGMYVEFTRNLMQYWLRRSHIREGMESLTQALAIREQLSEQDVAWTLTNLARTRQYVPSNDAGELYQEALVIAKRLDDREMQLTIHIGRTLHEVLKRQPEGAVAALAEAMAVPDVWQIAPGVTQPAFLAGLEGVVAIAVGDYPRAEAVAAASLERAFREQDEASLGILYRVRGVAAHEMGDLERAREHFLASLNAYNRFNEAWNVGNCLADLASLFLQDHPTLALRLAGAANRLFLIHGVHGIDPDHEPFRSAVNELRRRIGPEVVSRAWREGSDEPWNAALEEAKSTPVDRSESPAPRAVPILPSGSGGTLTPREHQVLLLIAAGMTDREIAVELGLTYRTITTYVSNILTKLDAPSRAAAISKAARDGFLRD